MMRRTPSKREHLIPAMLRPGMYAGPKGNRTRLEWLADSILAYNEFAFIMRQQ
jgi:hypothetical protein